MAFRDTLEHSCFCLDLKSDTKEGILGEMIDLLVAAKQVANRQAALDSVLEREARMSTGLQYGVAMPHGKTATVDRMVTALALKKNGVNFQSLDGQPCRIFVMTISPVNRTGPHIQYLAEMSKFLSSSTIRERLLAAQNKEEVLAIFT